MENQDHSHEVKKSPIELAAKLGLPEDIITYSKRLNNVSIFDEIQNDELIMPDLNKLMQSPAEFMSSSIPINKQPSLRQQSSGGKGGSGTKADKAPEDSKNFSKMKIFSSYLGNMQTSFGSALHEKRNKAVESMRKTFMLPFPPPLPSYEDVIDKKDLTEEEALELEESQAEVSRERRNSETKRRIRVTKTKENTHGNPLPLLEDQDFHYDETSVPNEMEGMLQKKSEKWFGFKGWQDKYCKLSKRIFTFFKPDQHDSFQGAINFDLMSFKIELEGNAQIGRSILMTPQGQQKVFRFRAKSNEDTLKWFYAIHHANQLSDGLKYGLVKLYKEPKFWKFERLSYRQLLKTVDSGDILLFSSASNISNIQRVFTRSRYDHVAMFIVSYTAFGTKEVYVFEASGGEGVGLTRFENFITYKWYELYTRLVYRKLTHTRDETFYQTLQGFVNNTKGKQYKIDATKLLKKQSIIMTNENFSDRTFFCSELVAAGYKRLGLLPKERSSTQYWPGSFSQESENDWLPLQKGASLSQEYLLAFNDDDGSR